MKYTSFILLGAVLCTQSLNSLSQDTNNSDDAKIVSRWKQLDYKPDLNPPVKIPKRKYDSPFFCDEMIPYKGGYIINDIETRPAPQIETATRFFFIDLLTDKIAQFHLPGIDTIESLLTGNNEDLYCAYKENGAHVISLIPAGTSTLTKLPLPDDLRAALDTAQWVKLGYEDSSLFVLTPNIVYNLTGDRWKERVRYSLDQYMRQTLHYRRSLALLPTRNIRIKGNNIWFLQEIVQQRSSLLFQLDLQTGQLNEFFSQLGYTDRSLKVINGYTVLSDGTLLVTAMRLYYNYMSVSLPNGTPEVWTYNNMLNTESDLSPTPGESQVPLVEVSAVTYSHDTIYMAGINGLFRKWNNQVEPLLRWSHSQQNIKEAGSDIQFDFIPRELMQLSDHQFLMGGIYGGLYLVDLTKKQIKCLDDITDNQIGSINLAGERPANAHN